MSDAPKIEPALSPEEWAKRLQEMHKTVAELAREAKLFGPPPTPREMFADAAVVLHVSGLGFTREDVELLRSVAEDNRVWRMVAGVETDAQLDALADGTEALLPPP